MVRIKTKIATITTRKPQPKSTEGIVLKVWNLAYVGCLSTNTIKRFFYDFSKEAFSEQKIVTKFANHLDNIKAVFEEKNISPIEMKLGENSSKIKD